MLSKIKHLALSLFFVAFATTEVAAQTSFDEMKADRNRFGGVYLPYPVAADARSQSVTAPKGYEVFYISHFSRHGSRYLIGDRDLDIWATLMAKADSAGALTQTGKEVAAKLATFQDEMHGRGGELTPLGWRQHRGIGRRMAKAYPGVFADGAVVTAVSTPVMRCAYSMMAFTDGLRDEVPGIEVPRESSERNMRYLNYHSKASNDFNDHGPNKLTLKKYRTALTHPDRLVGSLFTDSAFVNDNVDPAELMWGLYWIAADLPNTETGIGGIDLYDIFTDEELFDLWRASNYDFYIYNATYPKASELHKANAATSVGNIVDTAADYIASGRHGATLRFAHDGNIVPLTALLGIEDCYGEALEPDSVHTVWANWKVAPMASNVQLVFARSKKDPKDIIVAFMHNEQPRRIPPLEEQAKPLTGTYWYRWADVEPYLRSLAAKSM